MTLSLWADSAYSSHFGGKLMLTACDIITLVTNQDA